MIKILFLFFIPFVVLGSSDFEKHFINFSKLKSMKAKFSQTKFIKTIGISISSEGEVLMNKPSFFIWKINKPGQLEFIYDQGNLRLIENKKEIMNIKADSAAKEAVIMVDFLKSWLTMDKNYIIKNYKILEINNNQYKFIPTSQVKLFNEIVLTINGKAKISQMVMTELSGDNITLNFTDHINKYEK